MIRKAKRDKLVSDNMGLVISIAKAYSNAGVDFADLIQAGSLGLILASRKYDPKRPTKFITMATWWVKKQIREAVLRKHVVHIPFNRQIQESRESRENSMRHSRTGEELHTGKRCSFVSDIYLDSPELRVDCPRLMDLDDQIDYKRKTVNLFRAFHKLSETEKKVIGFYYDGKGPSEIGRKLKVSKQRVSQIYKKAEKKLQTAHRNPIKVAKYTSPAIKSTKKLTHYPLLFFMQSRGHQPQINSAH
jgi:RNA polymerase sigma factor (sigma-70 family)